MKISMLMLSVSASCLLAGAPANATETFKADLGAVNADKIGTSPSGTATLTIDGDQLSIHIKMTNLPPNIQHWEHFHGFPQGGESRCVTSADDKNGDGFLDLEETSAAAGTTMVPFNDAPEKMDIPTDSYPVADAAGNLEYTKIVPLGELEKKFGETYQGGKLDLASRVIFVHGVPTDMKLPATLGGQVGHYGTHTTLPIACGKIVRQ